MSDDPVVDASCPRCDEPITGQEGRCPSCGLDFLDDDGGLSQEAIDEMLSDVGIDHPDAIPRGDLYPPRWVRLLVGLSITVPMGPLVLFVAESVAPIPLWLSLLAFTLGWLVPGYLLSRFPVPSLVVAGGLLVVGATMAVTPLVIVAGRAVLGTEASAIGAFGSNMLAVQTAFLLIGLAVLGLGAIVYRQATAKRESWAEQSVDEGDE
jgi:hypothetical protein